MADVYAGESITPPARVNIPQIVGNAGRTDHYLDGCFMEEVDAIRIVNSAGPSIGGGGYSIDNIDPLDMPTAAGGSGAKKALKGSNTPLAAFIAGDNRGILRLTTGTVAAGDAAFAIRNYVNQAGATPIGPFALIGNSATGGAVANGKRAWYTTSIAYPNTGADAIASGIMLAGLVPAAYAPTTALTTPTDGFFFLKAATNTTTDFIVQAASAQVAKLTSVEALAGAPALGLGVFFEYSFRIDPSGTIYVYVNGRLAGTITLGNAAPFGTALTVGHGRDNNGGATAQILDQDYELLCYEI